MPGAQQPQACRNKRTVTIAVLTKADALKIPALSQLMKEKGLTSWREAKPMVDEFVIEMLRKLRTRIESQLSGYKYPPMHI